MDDDIQTLSDYTGYQFDVKVKSKYPLDTGAICRLYSSKLCESFYITRKGNVIKFYENPTLHQDFETVRL